VNTIDAAPEDLRPIDRVALRRIVYALLIVISASEMTGRILQVKSKSGRTPMLSANDRSRWANIRALVDHGTYEIDAVSYRPTGHRDPEWYSIDMVKHRGRDGREHYYSSKPTLFNTLVAIPYWIVKQATGRTLERHPFNVIRFLLVLFNVIPMIAYFAILAWMVERLGTTDFGRIMSMAAATFGTYLSTFAVSLNNHLPAAVCVIATLGVLLQIIWYGKQRARWFALAGFLASMAAANELPALSFCCLIGLLLLWISPKETLRAFLPAVLLVVIAAIGTNYIAHGTWSTPYAHRRDGRLVATIPGVAATELRTGRIQEPLRSKFQSQGLGFSERATLAERPDGRGWVLWDPQQANRWALVATERSLQIREWDNWYEYEGSYWTFKNKQGVDRGEASRLVYAFHALIGHHGIFSLTPLWIASVAGGYLWLRRGSTSQQVLAATAFLLTFVCLVFYIGLRGVEDRNYGGVSCCLRWMLWLAPLWLLCLLPACDAVADSALWRKMMIALLGLSVISASYNSMNPWSHPWLFNYWSYLGWIQY
jgi:hypothetical protein